MEDEHYKKLLYLEMESHIKGMIQRENRLLQLRLISFTLVTGILAFIPRELNRLGEPKLDTGVVWCPLLAVMVGLFCFDWYYSKLNYQQANRVRELGTSQKKLELFPTDLRKLEDGKGKLKLKARWKNWWKAKGLDHFWYLFVYLLGLLITRLPNSTN